MEIDLSVIRKNIRNIISKTGKEFLPVIKTDAYGIGLLQIAKILDKEKVKNFCVGNIEEAFLLKDNKIGNNIIILNPVLTKEIKEAVKNNFVFPVWSRSFLKEVLRVSTTLGKKPRIQIEIDTGMGRCGVPIEKASFLLDEVLKEREKINLFGIFTHFSKAENDKVYTQDQLSKFLHFLNSYLHKRNELGFIHASNSASLINMHKKIISSPFNSFRLGILMYGVSPFKDHRLPSYIKESIKIKTRIIKIEEWKRGTYIGYGALYRLKRNSKTAILPFGYSKGIIRKAWENGYVIVRRKKAKILGNLSMDIAVIDVTNIPEVKEGDLVIIVGKDGKEKISINDWAQWSDSIPHEILVRFAVSLQKKYKGNGSNP